MSVGLGEQIYQSFLGSDLPREPAYSCPPGVPAGRGLFLRKSWNHRCTTDGHRIRIAVSMAQDWVRTGSQGRDGDFPHEHSIQFRS